MNEVSFIQQRKPDWDRLWWLADKAESSPARLTSDELSEFVRLYRRVSDDLSLVRTQSSNLQLIAFLNDLVGRTYGTFYRPQTKKFGRAISEAIEISAQTVRKLRVFVLASVLSFLLAIGT